MASMTLTFMLLLMLTSLPLSHSSRALALGFEPGTAMAKQNMQMQKAEINGDARSEDEESARQVPTGPDPLHHNQNPITP